MFGGHKRALPLTAEAEQLAHELSAGGAIANGHREITLDSSCACGHTRRAHRGLRMDVKGPCLDCECQEFGQPGTGKTDEETIARINTAIEHVERMIAAARAVRADSG